jgi:hypothetical protein
MGCKKTLNHDEIESLGGGPKGSCDYIIRLAEPTPQLFASLAEVLRLTERYESRVWQLKQYLALFVMGII